MMSWKGGNAPSPKRMGPSFIAPAIKNHENQPISTLPCIFISLFVSLTLVLGSVLITILYTFNGETVDSQSEDTLVIKDLLLNHVNQSNEALIAASEYSISTLVGLVIVQVGHNMQSSIARVTSSAEFSINQMDDYWRWGYLDAVNFDKSFERLWYLAIENPSLAILDFGVASSGAFLGIQRLDAGRFLLLIKLAPGAVCYTCPPGLNESDPALIYLYYSEAFGQATAQPAASQPFDVFTRPWYEAGVQGGGSGLWTPVFPLVSPQRGSKSSVGLCASKLVLDDGGRSLGVVSAGVQFDFISSFLIKALMDLYGIVGTISDWAKLSQAANGLTFVAVDRRGLLLGVTSNASMTTVDEDGFAVQKHWSDGIPPGTLHHGVQVVSDFWTGNWSRLLAEAPVWEDSALDVLSAVEVASSGSGGRAAAMGGLRQYQDPLGLLVGSAVYRNTWGFEVILMMVVEPKSYHARMDATIAQAKNQTGARAAEVELLIHSAETESDRRDRDDLISMVACAVVVLLLGSWFIRRLSMKTSETLQNIADRMLGVSTLDFSRNDRLTMDMVTLREVVVIRESFLRMAISVQAFARYVPQAVVRMVHLGNGVASLGVKKRDVTIMFCKAANFAEISAEMDHVDVIPYFAEFLDAVSECIDETGGTVGKYIDDTVMAFWNSPNQQMDHGTKACNAALAQKERLLELRAQWASRGMPPLYVRIGISAGPVLHGNIGCRKRMEWGMIGDQVNLASRLEAMGKYYGTGILISGALLSRLPPGRFLTRPIDRVVAYGKREVTEVHELVAHRSSATPDEVQTCEGFAAVTTAYRGRRFAEALALAEAHLARFVEDRLLAEMYIKRCIKHLDEPPPEDWDAVFVLMKK